MVTQPSQPSKAIDESLVTIKPLAYYKMLVHVLRFGNKVRHPRQFREVMGALVGYLTDEKKGKYNNVMIEDVFPVSHGGSIEVAFKIEDYIPFEMINTQVIEENPNMFVIGWYHSHPGIKIFFSSTDVRNQLGWQTEMNLSGVGIVFDHQYLETPGDLGFRTFRLDDPSKGPLSDYHEVKTIVEPPDNLEYYIKIMELINCIYNKEPPILEVNETPDVFGDITLPGQNQMMAKQPDLGFMDLLTALQKGVAGFIESIFEPLIRFLNKWSQDMIKNVVDNNLKMRNDLVSLKEGISTGISEVQSIVKNSLVSELYKIEGYIDDSLEFLDTDKEEINKIYNEIKENLTNQINDIFEKDVIPSLNPIIELLNQNSEKMVGIEETINNSTENLQSQSDMIKNLAENLKKNKELLSEKLNDGQEKIKKMISNKIIDLSSKTSSLNKQTKEFSTNLDAALSILESSKQTLSEKLKKTEEPPKTEEGGGA